MSRDICEYVAATLVSGVNSEDNPFSKSRTEFTGDFQHLKELAGRRCGLLLPDQLVRDAVRVLADCGLVRITDDPYSGTFYKIKVLKFDDFTQTALSEIAQARDAGYDTDAIFERRSDYPNGAAYLRHSVISDYHELGDDWLKRALAGIQQQVADGLNLPKYVESEFIPASDRVVSIDDNTRATIGTPLDNILEELKSNSVIEELGDDAERLRTEIKSGRELVRSTNVRLAALFAVLLKPLQFLAEKFAASAIGELAKELFHQLIKLL